MVTQFGVWRGSERLPLTTSTLNCCLRCHMLAAFNHRREHMTVSISDVQLLFLLIYASHSELHIKERL